MPCKLFVGCLPFKPEATREELEDYFRPFGEISDVYIPKPYRGFGFVTFQEGNDVQKVLSQTHRLRNSTLNITQADPKGAPRRTTTAESAGGTTNYGYGFGSQFYNPQTPQPQGVYFYGAPPQGTPQYNYNPRGFTPQQQFSAGARGPVDQPPHVESYQQQGNDVPPPAKRPHPGGGQHMGEVHSGGGGEQYYGGGSGGGGGFGGGGGEGFGGNGARYRGGGWPQ